MKEDQEEAAAWAQQQADAAGEGQDAVKRASDEALEYIMEVASNMEDREYRLITVARLSREIGAGLAIADHVVPEIYGDMKKNLHKKAGVSKTAAEMLSHLYMGRLIKNIVEELSHGINK